MNSLRARITLHSLEDGGREHGVELSGGYRPHLRVNGGELLGVELISDESRRIEPGHTALVDLRLLYDIDYSALAPGARFVIAEGARVVGAGWVI